MWEEKKMKEKEEKGLRLVVKIINVYRLIGRGEVNEGDCK